MKLSLWQQFSSNHSASFRLVGQFESEVAAQQATKKLQAMFHELDKWWQAIDPEKRDEVYLSLFTSNRLTPPESNWRQAYQLSSQDHLLDWWTEYPSYEGILHQTRTLLIIDPGSTWSYPYLFIELIEKWGGKANFESTLVENNLFLELTCKLRNTSIAQEMWQQIEQVTNEVGKPSIRVPQMQFTQGFIERKENTIYFHNVELSPDFLLGNIYNQASFQSQLENLLNFAESFEPVVMQYEFYHTPPLEFLPPEEPQ